MTFRFCSDEHINPRYNIALRIIPGFLRALAIYICVHTDSPLLLPSVISIAHIHSSRTYSSMHEGYRFDSRFTVVHAMLSCSAAFSPRAHEWPDTIMVRLNCTAPPSTFLIAPSCIMLGMVPITDTAQSLFPQPQGQACNEASFSRRLQWFARHSHPTD